MRHSETRAVCLSVANDLEREIPALRRFAWALTRRTDEADDLVQDCMERALTRGHSFQGHGTLRAWMFSVLHNLFVSSRRRSTRRRTVPLEDAPEPWHPPGQDLGIAVHEILTALELLPPEQRAVLLLVGVEDLTYEETALALDVPVGTVMSRLSRGRARLRHILSETPPLAGGVTIGDTGLRVVK